MKRLLVVALLGGGCRGFHDSNPALGNMTPWSLAAWFGDCRDGVELSNFGYENVVLCRENAGASSWTVVVDYSGSIRSFTLREHDVAAVHRAFMRHANRLLGDRVAAHLEPSVSSVRRAPVSDVNFRVESGPALGKFPSFVRFTWSAREGSETDETR